MNQDFQLQIDAVNKRIDKLIKEPLMPDHYHNGFDSSRVNFSDIYQKKAYIHYTITGSPSVHQKNFGTFFIVPFACTLSKFQEEHDNVGTDAGAVTVTLEKLTSGQAPDAGTVMITTPLSLKAASCTVQTGTVSGTPSAVTLAAGDRLSLKDAGVLTGVTQVTVSVELLIT